LVSVRHRIFTPFCVKQGFVFTNILLNDMSTPNTGHLKRARESEIVQDESADKSMILTAQHKALATNLYRYKRRISQLETNVNGLSEANQTLYQSIAAITARVALVSIYLD
jgi:hypothetical protein